jgi:F-type H+-transporting ATPase subunit a
MFSPIEKFDVINLAFFNVAGFFDLSLTSMSIYLLFVFVTVVFFVGFFNVNSNALGINFTQLCVELFLVFVFAVVDKQIGKKGYIYFPFVFSLFCFILFSNLYGITPFSFAPTSHVVVTFFFSIMVWCMAIFIGILENGVGFYKLFVPNVPIYMLPFLIIIELLSYAIRVFSLAIRLAANITSGHVLLFTIAGFAVKLFKLNWVAAISAGVLLLLVFVLELGVAFLQAYVFITLVCIYFNDSLNLSH